MHPVLLTFTTSMRIVRKVCLLLILMLLISVSWSIAQTTGKISGRISDKKTNEGMIGSNVYLEGTTLGASTDIDGFYIILNAPPGVYTLVVDQIGYQKTIIENVEVEVNSTTTINISIEEAVVEGEEVTVVAEKPLIPKDQTGSKEVVSSEEIDLLPVTNFDQVVSLQGGVVNGRFRGGRSDEVLYMVDGIPVNSPATGSRASTVGIEAVENLEVISGTFNAEYGRAMSGVVNAVTKEGSQEYHGNLEIYAGNYYSSGSLLGHDLYPENKSFSLDGIRDIRGSLDGPVPFTGKKLSFVVSGGSLTNGGYLTGNGRRLFNTNTIHDPEAANAGIFNLETGDGKAEPLNDFWSWDLLAKMYFPFVTSTSLSYTVLLNQSRGLDPDGNAAGYSGYRRFVPDGIGQLRRESINHIATLKHVFGPTAFGTFKLAYLDETLDFYLDEDPLSPRYLPGAYSQDTFTGGALAIGGTNLFDFNRSSQTLTLKGDLVWQLHRQHEIKTGVEYFDYQLDQDGKAILFADSAGFMRDMEAGLVDQWRPRTIRETINNQPVNVDFQYFHNTKAGDRAINVYDAEASQFALYLQDKMEFSKVVINAGARFDYFNSKGRVPQDTRDPNGQITYGEEIANGELTAEEALDLALKDAEVQTQLSPRFGLAYQATSNGIVHFSYGHFFQIPPLANLYVNPQFLILPGNISSAFIGNTDLKAQRTVTYELAYSDLITENIAGEVIFFYRDIYDLLGGEILETANDQLYFRYTNVDYGNVKGVILSLDLRWKQFSAVVDYTFQNAEGNSSDPGAAFTAAQGGEEPNLEVIRLDWDQRQTVSATVGYTSSKFSGSVIWRLGSGNPFSFQPLPAPGRPELPPIPNNGQMPGNSTLDINAAYKIGSFSGLDVRVYFQGYNLLDTRNPAFVFGDSGSPSSTGTLEKQRNSLERATFTTPEQIVFDGTSYTSPRELRLGLGFRF